MTCSIVGREDPQRFEKVVMMGMGLEKPLKLARAFDPLVGRNAVIQNVLVLSVISGIRISLILRRDFALFFKNFTSFRSRKYKFLLRFFIRWTWMRNIAAINKFG